MMSVVFATIEWLDDLKLYHSLTDIFKLKEPLMINKHQW